MPSRDMTEINTDLCDARAEVSRLEFEMKNAENIRLPVFSAKDILNMHFAIQNAKQQQNLSGLVALVKYIRGLSTTYDEKLTLTEAKYIADEIFCIFK